MESIRGETIESFHHDNGLDGRASIYGLLHLLLYNNRGAVLVVATILL